MSYCSACITVLPGLATSTIFFPVEKIIFRTFRTTFSLISSLRVKKEYKTIYKKITQEPGRLPTSAAIRTPYGVVSLEFSC